MSRVEDAYRRLRGVAPGQSGDRASDDAATVSSPLERYPREDPAVSALAGSTESRRDPSHGESPAPQGERSHVSSARRERSLTPVRRVPPGPVVPVSQASRGAQPDLGSGSDVQAENDGRDGNPSALIGGSIRVLAKRKWLVLALIVAAFSVSFLFLRTIKPVFRATTRLAVETRTTADALLRTTSDAPQQGYLETLAEVMRSRSLAEATAMKLALWEHLEYAAVSGGAVPVDGGSVPEGVVDRLMANTTVATVPGSTVLNVTVQSGDPALASKAANALAQLFIERDLESRMKGAKDATDWIGRQLEEQRARVTETEAALQRYRESQSAASLDERQNIVVQRLGDLNSAVTRARTDRIAKEELSKRVTELQGQQALLDSVPAVAANAFVQQLKGQVDQLDRQLKEASATLGERHPEIVRLTSAKADASKRLAAEVDTVAAALKNDYLTALAEERSLAAALEGQKQEALELDRKGVEYAALSREAESNRALYQSLLEQAKAVGMSSDLQRSNVRVLDAAPLPRSPVNPLGRMGLLLAAIASVTFAVGVAFVVEFLDPRIRTLDDVSNQLGLPLMGYVEQLRGVAGGPVPLISQELPARFKEAVGRIRASIEGQTGVHGGVLLATSASPKEGKTFVGSNLALGFALAGRRVLLIDCDLRRSRVHEAFGIQREPGLMTFLDAPTATWESMVQAGPCPGLSILTAGPAAPNPVEALGREAFADLIAAARETYDWIVIDRPP
jgi:polysaccharide biosynthesis transport protein